MEYFVAIMLACIFFAVFMILLRLGVEVGELLMELKRQNRALDQLIHQTHWMKIYMEEKRD